MEWPDLKWYGFEQQACIIEDYFRLVNHSKPAHVVSVITFDMSVYEDKDKGLLRYFLKNPNYLPKKM